MIDIRERIHKKFANGVLPNAAPRNISAGHGTGATCSGCDDVIQGAHSEYQFERQDGPGTWHFHAGCYGIWLRSVRRAELRHAQSQSEVARQTVGQAKAS